MRKAAALALLMLAGCDAVTFVEKDGPAFSEVRNRSGWKAGYCYTCMPGFDGKMSCGFKFSSMCSCSYKAKVLVQPIRVHHESGKVRHSEQTSETERLSACI